MPLDEYTKSRILEVSQEHFFRLNFSKVTMSEIAEDLGMSKKTLYEYFPSKEELLSAVISSMQDRVTAIIDSIVADSSLDFVEKLKQLFSQGAVFHSKFSPHFLMDIQRNAPHVWKCCDTFRMERLRGIATRIVREGVQQKMIRDDINEQVLIVLYSTSIQNLVTPEMMAQIPITMKQLFETILSIFLEGILTEEGRTKHFPNVLSHNLEPGILS